ncbi:MAG: DUF456 domain-containing protein [Phycisphaeraceae bacterium]
MFLWALGLAIWNLGMLLLTLIGMPGNWLMILFAALVTWWVDPPFIGKWTFVAVVLIAGLGELIELLAGAMGSKIGGGGKWSSLAALVGGIGGAILGTILIPIPVLGTILGAAIGAFTGSAGVELYTGKTRGDAFRAGRGAAIGHVTGNASKFALGGVVWVVLTVAAFA